MTARRIVVLSVCALLVASCAGAEPATLPNDVQVTVTLNDYKIVAEPDHIKAGTIKFGIKNTAAMEHQFDLIKTDLAADKLTVDASTAMVNVEAAGTLVKQVKGIGGGRVATVSADLQPGHYVIICNIAGHYQLGMHTDFTVE